MTVDVAPRPAIEPVTRVTRLLVARRDPETRLYASIGFLSLQEDRFAFDYLTRAVERPDFVALPGLPVAGGPFRSRSIFPVFAERIMSPRRPDWPALSSALGLPETAEPIEVLARTGGRRMGDAIELVPVPEVGAGGRVTMDFFVHGIRHMGAEAVSRIPSLRVGERLRLVSEPSNAVDPRAIVVTDGEQLRLGYMPAPLTDIALSLGLAEVTVLRANGPEVGFHFRLLVRITGRIEDRQLPFSGPEWAIV